MNNKLSELSQITEEQALAEWRERRLMKDRETIQLALARKRNEAINRGLIAWIDSKNNQYKKDP